jgi:hypothetical protein
MSANKLVINLFTSIAINQLDIDDVCGRGLHAIFWIDPYEVVFVMIILFRQEVLLLAGQSARR